MPTFKKRQTRRSRNRRHARKRRSTYRRRRAGGAIPPPNRNNNNHRPIPYFGNNNGLGNNGLGNNGLGNNGFNNGNNGNVPANAYQGNMNVGITLHNLFKYITDLVYDYDLNGEQASDIKLYITNIVEQLKQAVPINEQTNINLEMHTPHLSADVRHLLVELANDIIYEAKHGIPVGEIEAFMNTAFTGPPYPE